MNTLTGELDVHYTWIGKPKLDDSDVGGPTAMSAALSDDHWTTHHIYFWCLDAHVSTFSKHFAQRKCLNVTVRGIQSFLKTCTGTLYKLWYWYGANEDFAVSGVNEIIASACRMDASVREYVNGKNAWSLFLLYTWGGYVMDTGLWPGSRRVTLPFEHRLKAPAAVSAGEALSIAHYTLSQRASRIGKLCTTTKEGLLSLLLGGGKEPKVTSSDSMYHFDVWLLCSPKHDEGAWRALEWYLLAWRELEGWRAKPPKDFDDAAYRDCCRYAIMGAVYNGLSHRKGLCVAPDEKSFWDVGSNMSANPARVPALHLEKRYGGSHSASSDKKVSMGD